MQKKTLKFNDNLLDTYCRQIKSYPLLNFDEELTLSRQIQDTNAEDWLRKAALHKLINSNLRLVVKISGLFSVCEIPVMDLIQEGNLGLIQAAKKFDHKKNVRFCTYAGWWIRQFMSRYISNRRRMIRLPERKEEILRKIKHAYHALCQTLKHQPNNTDIAGALGISVADVESFIYLAMDTNHETGHMLDIHEDYTYSPEHNFMKQATRDGTNHVLGKLLDKERRILNYRYQLNGCKRHTLREIGDKLKISPETVRKIEQRALRKIRSHANELKEYIYMEAI